MNNVELPQPKIVSSAEWLEARRRLLAREKEATRLRDELAQERRELPWVKVEKAYRFEGPERALTLGDLFQGRSQLCLYHFMFAPDWDEGCRGCSFVADHVDAARQHFEHHDLSFVAVSRAPWKLIAPFRERMGWKFLWVSSNGTDFNYDFHVSSRPEAVEKGRDFYNFEEREIEGDERPGLSMFYRDASGAIFHTYSGYARGLEGLLGTYQFIDLTPKGRMETGPLSWVKYHDRYE